MTYIVKCKKHGILSLSPIINDSEIWFDKKSRARCKFCGKIAKVETT